MQRDPTYCASCQHFPLAASVETKGRASCEWFGERGWDYPACVLYAKAGDREQRKPIVIRLMKEINSAKA